MFDKIQIENCTGTTVHSKTKYSDGKTINRRTKTRASTVDNMQIIYTRIFQRSKHKIHDNLKSFELKTPNLDTLFTQKILIQSSQQRTEKKTRDHRTRITTKNTQSKIQHDDTGQYVSLVRRHNTIKTT